MPIKKPSGRIVRPPPRPPTAVGTQSSPPPPSGAPRGPSRIFAIAGPSEDVGKTTICVNLALAWAGSQNRKVIIVPLSYEHNEKLAEVLGVSPPNLIDLTKRIVPDKSDLGLDVKGLVPFSPWGVGVLELAAESAAARSISPMYVAMILGWLSERYDLFLDVSPEIGFQHFANHFSDVTFWTCRPSAKDLDDSSRQLAALQHRNSVAFENLEIVVNEPKEHSELEPRTVTRHFGQIQKRILAWLPFDRQIEEVSIDNKILIVECIGSEWIKSGLRLLLGRLFESWARPKKWEIRERTWSAFEERAG